MKNKSLETYRKPEVLQSFTNNVDFTSLNKLLRIDLDISKLTDNNSRKSISESIENKIQFLSARDIDTALSFLSLQSINLETNNFNPNYDSLCVLSTLSKVISKIYELYPGKITDKNKKNAQSLATDSFTENFQSLLEEAGEAGLGNIYQQIIPLKDSSNPVHNEFYHDILTLIVNQFTPKVSTDLDPVIRNQKITEYKILKSLKYKKRQTVYDIITNPDDYNHGIILLDSPLFSPIIDKDNITYEDVDLAMDIASKINQNSQNRSLLKLKLEFVDKLDKSQESQRVTEYLDLNILKKIQNDNQENINQVLKSQNFEHNTQLQSDEIDLDDEL